MSVDVFGRKLGKIEGNRRDPPGIGFKFTWDSQYDLDNKRLCIVGEATNSKEAVNLETLKRIVHTEIQALNHTITQLRKDLELLDNIVDIHRDELEEKIQILDLNIQSLKTPVGLQNGS